MEIKELKGKGKIRVAGTEIDVLHNGIDIAFAYPMNGPNTYLDVMSKITNKNLLRPTTAQMFSLINLSLQNPEEEHCKKILTILKSNYFWTSTENLYTRWGVFVYDNINGMVKGDKEDLTKRLEAGDESVRFVLYGFKTERQSVLQFIKNPYIIAQTGKELMPIVEEVTIKLKRNPHVWTYDWKSGSQKENIQRYTALSSIWGDGKFDLNGNFNEDDESGYAIGICNIGEASCKNKQ